MNFHSRERLWRGFHAIQHYKYIYDLEKGKNNEVAKVADEITLFKTEKLKDDSEELQKALWNLLVYTMADEVEHKSVKRCK